VNPVFAVRSRGPDEAEGRLLEEAARNAELSGKTRMHGAGDGTAWIADQINLHFGTQGACPIDSCVRVFGGGSAGAHPRRQGTRSTKKIA